MIYLSLLEKSDLKTEDGMKFKFCFSLRASIYA